LTRVRRQLLPTTGDLMETSVPPKKQSYESNRDVQRWLREQRDEHAAGELPFAPTFLAARRDSDWILSSLGVFYQQGLITDVISQTSSGKEATVYCCLAHPDTGAEHLAAKVYRPRMFRSLRNDAIYRESRAAVDERGRATNRERGRRSSRSDSQRGRSLQVSAWIQTEYEVQRELFGAGACVPKPYAQIGNAILMEWIGAGDEGAPRLSDVKIERQEAQPLFDILIATIGLMLAHHRIHGDLSAYNVLYHNGSITVIDLAQMVDPRYNPDVYPVFERDVERVCRYFARHGVVADAGRIAGELWSRYLSGELETTA
jgi:RIO kinase 1